MDVVGLGDGATTKEQQARTGTNGEEKVMSATSKTNNGRRRRGTGRSKGHAENRRDTMTIWEAAAVVTDGRM